MILALPHGLDRLLAEVFADQLEGSLRGFARDQGIEHDPAGIPLHEGDVGQVIAAHLVDAIRHLVQPVLHVELGIAPQARIDRIRRRLVEPDVFLVRLQVPDDVSLRILDGQRCRRIDEAAPGILEILLVGKIQVAGQCLVGLYRIGRRRFAGLRGNCRIATTHHR